MARDLSSYGRLGTVLLDQGLASAAWYVPVLLVGRAVAPAEFGVFLIGFGVLATTMAVSRAMFGVVVGMDAAGTDELRLHRMLGLSSGGVLTLGAGVALILAVASGPVGEGSLVLLLLAPAAPLVLLQDLARYTAVALARPKISLLIDVVWTGPSYVALGLDVAGIVSVSAAEGLSVWLTSTAASVALAGYFGVIDRPQFSGLRHWLLSDTRRRDLGGESLLSGIVPVANGWGAALVGGATAVAAVRGAAMLFAPVMMLMLVVTLAAVPEARRREPAAAKRWMVGLTSALVIGAAGWAVVALALPDSVGRGLMGASWSKAEPVVGWLCVESVGAAVWVGGGAMLRCAGATGMILRLRVAYAPVAVVAPVIGLAVTGNPQTFAAVLALVVWTVGPTSAVLGYRALDTLSTTRDGTGSGSTLSP